MPSPLDVSFAVFFSIVIAGVEGAYFDRRFKRQVAAGAPDARRNAYRRAIIGQWALAGLTIALWSSEGRPWRALGLVPPTDWRLYTGLALGLLIATFFVRQHVRVRALAPDRVQQLAPKIAGVEFMLPHSAREYQWFLALSWTAGVCEELLYRGFLTWVVASYVSIGAAVVIVSLVFGLAHAYQGPKGVVKTATAALVMSGIVLLSGWLIPAMIIHALTDVSGGSLGFAVLRQQRSPLATGQ